MPDGSSAGIVRLEGRIYIDDRRSEPLVLYLLDRGFKNRESLLFFREPYWLASIVVDTQGEVNRIQERVYTSLQELGRHEGREEFASISSRSLKATETCGHCQ